MSHFDYLPNNLIPPSFGQVGEFEASLQSTEFYPEMFMNNRSLPSVQPLSQDQSLLLPSHQIVSPSSSIASSSPSPSSPSSGPFTPTQAMLSSFSQLCASDFGPLPNGECVQAPQTQTDAELQTELQLQQDLYSSFSWENNSIWPSGGEMLLGDDFDLGAIPPIELGLPKFSDDMNMTTPHSHLSSEFAHEFARGLEIAQYDNQNVDGMYGFDEMMHGF
jgi:hypothetical protein